MSDTFRKDRNDKIFKESLKKKCSTSRYRCRCERCVGKHATIDKIAEKELKEQIKNDEYNFDNDGNYIGCDCFDCLNKYNIKNER